MRDLRCRVVEVAAPWGYVGVADRDHPSNSRCATDESPCFVVVTLSRLPSEASMSAVGLGEPDAGYRIGFGEPVTPQAQRDREYSALEGPAPGDRFVGADAPQKPTEDVVLLYDVRREPKGGGGVENVAFVDHGVAWVPGQLDGIRNRHWCTATGHGSDESSFA